MLLRQLIVCIRLLLERAAASEVSRGMTSIVERYTHHWHNCNIWLTKVTNGCTMIKDLLSGRPCRIPARNHSPSWLRYLVSG